MLQTQSAGGVVVNRQGEILVASQHGTSWSLPKGHVETGENLRTAAEREIREETGISGLELEYVGDLGTYQRYRIDEQGGEDRSELKTITMFLFTTTQSELKPEDKENPEARWVERERVIDLLTHPKDKEFWQRAKFRVEVLERENLERR